MAPGWEHRNGASNVYDDIALVMLDRPVEGVTPVTLGGAPSELATILGKGRTEPGSTVAGGSLRRADLRTLTDKECTQAWGKALGNDGEHFKGSTMLCAIDPDGRAPLSSGCNGDSGGALYTGPDTAPRILGVVSYGGLKCGADHLPSVFAEVDHYRGFLLDATPTIAPVAHGDANVSGNGPRGPDAALQSPPLQRRRREDHLQLDAHHELRRPEGRRARARLQGAQARPRPRPLLRRRGEQRRRAGRRDRREARPALSRPRRPPQSKSGWGGPAYALLVGKLPARSGRRIWIASKCRRRAAQSAKVRISLRQRLLTGPKRAGAAA